MQLFCFYFFCFHSLFSSFASYTRHIATTFCLVATNLGLEFITLSLFFLEHWFFIYYLLVWLSFFFCKNLVVYMLIVLSFCNIQYLMQGIGQLIRQRQQEWIVQINKTPFIPSLNIIVWNLWVMKQLCNLQQLILRILLRNHVLSFVKECIMLGHEMCSLTSPFGFN